MAAGNGTAIIGSGSKQSQPHVDGLFPRHRHLLHELLHNTILVTQVKQEAQLSK